MKRTFRKSYEVKGARSLLFIIADHVPSFPSASRLHNMHLCDYAYDMHLQYVITQPPVIHHDTCCILHILSLQYEKSYKLLTMWKVLQLHQHTVLWSVCPLGEKQILIIIRIHSNIMHFSILTKTHTTQPDSLICLSLSIGLFGQ